MAYRSQADIGDAIRRQRRRELAGLCLVLIVPWTIVLCVVVVLFT